MCLIDTTDGALMMTLYTSTSLARDTVSISLGVLNTELLICI